MNFTDEQLERIVVAIEKIAGGYVVTPPSGNGQPGKPPVDLKTVVIGGRNAPLRYIDRLNKQDVGVLEIYGHATDNRIIAEPGKELLVFPGIVDFDGDDSDAMKVYSAQKVGGEWLPNSGGIGGYLWVLVRHLAS